MSRGRLGRPRRLGGSQAGDGRGEGLGGPVGGRGRMRGSHEVFDSSKVVELWESVTNRRGVGVDGSHDERTSQSERMGRKRKDAAASEGESSRTRADLRQRQRSV
jgi:hypothetical protein